MAFQLLSCRRAWVPALSRLPYNRRCSTLYAMADARATFQGAGSEELRNMDLGNCPCNKETPVVDGPTLQKYMKAMPAWQLNDSKKELRRSFVAKNFVAAIQFFNNVMEVAEAQGHHPDLHLTNFRNVEVVLSTHAIGGLSMHDLVMAAKIDDIEVTYSPKWLKEQQAVQT